MKAFDLVLQGADPPEAEIRALAALSGGRSVERRDGGAFRIAGVDPRSREAVAARADAAHLDWGYVEAGRRLGDFGLVAFDMDSTLVTVECIDEIADFAGRKAEVAAVTAAATRGELDWPASLRQRVAALAGLEARVLETVYRERLLLTPGAEALVAAVRRAGARTLLVSGGFTYFTDRLRDRLGLDEAHSNELVVEDGRLAGRVTGPFVDAKGKAGHVSRLRQALGLPRSGVLVIGDGANDLEMMAEAGTSVAYKAKAVVRSRATYALNHSGLDGVLALFPP